MQLSTLGSQVPNQTPLAERDISRSVRLEKVKLLYSNIPLNIIASFMAALLLVYTQSHFIESESLILWLVAIILIAVVRSIIFIAYKFTPSPTSLFWEIAFNVTVFITAIIWAVAILSFSLEDNLVSQVLLAVIILAIAAGSVSSLSYIKVTGAVFLCILMLPLIYKSFTVESEYTLVLGSISTIFLLFSLITSFRFYNHVTKSIELGYKSLGDAEAIRVSKKQAEHANAAKSIFLSSMSHELRTPMNAIMGFTQIMQINRDKNLTPTQSHNLEEIMSASEHLLSLIDDILDLSQIESGDFNINPEEVGVEKIIKDSVAMFFHQSKIKNVHITIQQDIDALKIYADPSLFKKVIINLLRNAIEYNHQGGQVNITAGIYDEIVTISISDTGSGISESDIKQLFQPFHRLDIENNVNGAGIGLSLSKKIVEKMGGTIGLESTVGEGSRFWITLPSFK